VSLPPLLVVTDRTQAVTSLEEVVAEALAAGAEWILFRDKDLEPEARHTMAERLAALTRRAGARLSISRDVDLAASLGADLHVQTPGAVAEARARLGDAVIGLSAHNLADVEAGAKAGADYMILSPIFPSPSKPGYGPPLGPGVFRQAPVHGPPLYALGGLTPENAAACLAAGAAGVAAMGEIMRDPMPGRRTREFLAALAARAEVRVS
jgi:thiamine-phosphate pyrophosphorylase